MKYWQLGMFQANTTISLKRAGDKHSSLFALTVTKENRSTHSCQNGNNF
jgi:hypothetical protein